MPRHETDNTTDDARLDDALFTHGGARGRRWSERARLDNPALEGVLPRLGLVLRNDTTHVRVGWLLAAMTLSMTAAGVAVMGQRFHLWRPPAVIDRALSSLFIVCWLIGAPLSIWWALRAGPLARSTLRRARCRLCIWCGHDLTGRPRDRDICPECGRRLSTRDAVILWCRRLRR